jgi:hypothetical protein
VTGAPKGLVAPHRLTSSVLGILGLLVLIFGVYVGFDSYRAVGQARALYEVGVLGLSIEGDIQFYARRVGGLLFMPSRPKTPIFKSLTSIKRGPPTSESSVCGSSYLSFP